MNERIHTADNVRRWFILRHPKPEMLNDILSGRKKVFLSADDDAAALPPFEHYIPFADMAYRPSKAEVDPDNYKPYNPILDGEALRADLHSFVFLKVTPRQMEAILQSEWNHALKYWLRPFRGKDGELLVVSDHEMQTFRNAIKCQDFKVCKGIPVENFQNGDRVMVVSGPMQGSEGEVSKIRVREGRATLSIVFSMFNNSLAIEVPNIPFEDVRLKDKEAENLLADDIIAKMEDQLIELIDRLFERYRQSGHRTADEKFLLLVAQKGNDQTLSPRDPQGETAVIVGKCGPRRILRRIDGSRRDRFARLVKNPSGNRDKIFALTAGGYKRNV